jgi:hypothetical protein
MLAESAWKFGGEGEAAMAQQPIIFYHKAN